MFSRLGFGGSGAPPTPKRARAEVFDPTPAPSPAPTPVAALNGGGGDGGGVAGAAKAIRLVYCDEKGRFRMEPEAVAALQMVKGPIGVVSVCGRARQGKSFILNQLLGRSSGFQVGPTHRPCTKGLWMWSSPLKRTAPDGTEYNLLLLDSEGIDAYDQTGTYSTQIFSLAVLLSSMFVYNQMGGIDEAALDRLSLVTQMTKHIRVRASQKSASADELGQFSPVFLWLLRDFYLDLSEDGRKITPREYVESALQPMPGTGQAIYAKNEIRESIRALFPDRHCFTLVRPVNEEIELQRLDIMPMDRMRSEFRTGIDNLTKFIFERTRPKQLGSTVMTGPMLAGLTQSFLDAINAGAVPTIATSWQNVEENECRRAYEMAVDAYMKFFDKSAPPDLNVLQETYERALESAISLYRAEAVGAGPIRSKYEKQLQTSLRKHFEEYKQKASMEAELKCVRVIQGMEEKLRASCYSPQASLEGIINVLNELILQYEVLATGPAKWEKAAKFLKQSLDGPVSDLFKKVTQQAASHASSLEMKCRSLEDKLSLSARQVEAAQRESVDWKRRYESALAECKAATEVSGSQYASLQSKLSKMEERRASLTQQLEVAMKEALDWQNKYDHALGEQRLDEERHKAEYAALNSRCSAAEARLAAAREQTESAKEEAAEWRRKHDTVLTEARSTAERYNALRERGNKQQQQREDTLRSEYTTTLSQKDALLNETQGKLEQSERLVAELQGKLQIKSAEAESYEKRLEDREHEIEAVLQDSHDQRVKSVHVLEGLLESERAAHSESNARAESLSLQLQTAQGKIDALQHELSTSRLNETAMETKLRAQAETSARRKRCSDEDTERTPAPTESRGRQKRARVDLNMDNGSCQGFTQAMESMDDHASTEQQQQQQKDYRRFTVAMLKQELTNAGFGARVLQMKSAPKREIIALYEQCVLGRGNEASPNDDDAADNAGS